MFIKFGDKTKKIIVKSSNKEDEESDDDTIYMNDNNDRRVDILKEYEEKHKKITQSD